MLTFKQFCKEVEIDYPKHSDCGRQRYVFRGKVYEFNRSGYSGLYGEWEHTKLEFLHAVYPYHRNRVLQEEKKSKMTRLVNLLAGIKNSRTPKPVRMIYGREPEMGTDEWYRWIEHAN